ncbi:PHP domain-containing protein [Treponema sp.]
MSVLADLHNHSCLSPCGSLDLSPRLLVSIAAAKGLGLLALTDHNSTLNCPAFATSCRAAGVLPVFGMEATTREEVHVLCHFASLEAALSFGDKAYELLAPIPNNPEKMGDQVYVDADDNIEGEVEHYLGLALDLGIDEIADLVSAFGGLVIPAHVDRPAFSMTSQLGFVMDGDWSALECTRLPPSITTLGYPLITSSDAHYPEHVGRRPFSLDIEIEELAPNGLDADIDIQALRVALARRPRT